MENQGLNFISIYSTPKSTEVALIKSLLSGADIRYFVSNENLNTLYGAADGFTSMDIMVEPDKAGEARELLNNLINPNRGREE